MANFVFKIISVFMHPIFMPLIALRITLLFLPISIVQIHPYIKLINIVFVLSTIFFPLLIVFFLMMIKKINSLEMSSTKERPLPLFLSSIVMLVGFIIIYPIISLAPVIKIEFLCSIIIVLAACVISTYWKISLHMIGVGGLLGAISALHLLYGGLTTIIIITMLAAGILGTARLTLNAHNKLQIYAGFILGFFIEFLGVLIFI